MSRRRENTCVAIGCDLKANTNLLSTVKTFPFPSDPELKQKWLAAIRRKDYKPFKGSVLCSRHFISGKPSKDPQHPDYVPSLFSFNVKGIEYGRKQLERYERSIKRMSSAPTITSSVNNGKQKKVPPEATCLSSLFSLNNDTEQEDDSQDFIPDITSDTEEIFECNWCLSVYNTKNNLQKHIKKKHPEKVIQKDKPFKCSKCGRSYAESKNLKKHERLKHGAPLNKRQTRLFCFICSHPYATLELLCSHITEVHGIEIEREYLEFSDENDFLQWKNSEEQNSNAAFVKHGKAKLTKIGELSDYYFCKRSGFFKRRGEKYLMKAQGSCKIDGFCTAHMKVKVKADGEHMVQYIKTHVGHSEDLEHLWLSKAQRDELALKIKNKVPFDEILNEVRSAPLTSLNRIHLLSRKDLYNIRKEYGLDKVKQTRKATKGNPPISNLERNIKKKMSELENRHQESLSLSDESVITYQDTFIVPSNTDNDEMYVVQLSNSVCNCKLRCKDCSVCVHNFTCSCADAKAGNMCKHIHLVCRINKISDEIEEDLSEEASASS